MTIYESMRQLAMSGKGAYEHKGKENKKVTALQDFLDEVYMVDVQYYKNSEGVLLK